MALVGTGACSDGDFHPNILLFGFWLIIGAAELAAMVHICYWIHKGHRAVDPADPEKVVSRGRDGKTGLFTLAIFMALGTASLLLIGFFAPEMEAGPDGAGAGEAAQDAQEAADKAQEAADKAQEAADTAQQGVTDAEAAVQTANSLSDHQAMWDHLISEGWTPEQLEEQGCFPENACDAVIDNWSKFAALNVNDYQGDRASVVGQLAQDYQEAARQAAEGELDKANQAVTTAKDAVTTAEDAADEAAKAATEAQTAADDAKAAVPGAEAAETVEDLGMTVGQEVALIAIIVLVSGAMGAGTMVATGTQLGDYKAGSANRTRWWLIAVGSLGLSALPGAYLATTACVSRRLGRQGNPVGEQGDAAGKGGDGNAAGESGNPGDGKPDTAEGGGPGAGPATGGGAAPSGGGNPGGATSVPGANPPPAKSV